MRRISILVQGGGILVARVFHSKLTRLLALLIVALHHTMLKAKQNTFRPRFEIGANQWKLKYRIIAVPSQIIVFVQSLKTHTLPTAIPMV